jgi:hypothetical protein
MGIESERAANRDSLELENKKYERKTPSKTLMILKKKSMIMTQFEQVTKTTRERK